MHDRIRNPVGYTVLGEVEVSLRNRDLMNMEHGMRRALALGILLTALAGLRPAAGAERTQAEVYAVTEIALQGPRQGPRDTPARDIELKMTLRHESGAPEITLPGFWDGDGRGGLEGDVFKIRFTPTVAGRWTVVKTESNVPQLAGQKQGDTIVAAPSRRHGFWLADEESPGRRWYRRSDGTHQYIIGNTQYSFLSGTRPRAGAAKPRETVTANQLEPSQVDIAADVRANARCFRKLRFSLLPDHYPHPTEKPFLDDEGKPTDCGDYSHRPNPRWFQERADTAVQAALECDLIADLILAGPDTEDARATLRAAKNGGDAAPWLRYVAARYGAYPNVWICLCNEYNIKTPKYSEAQVAALGRQMRAWLPYPTPLSVHASPPVVWAEAFDQLPAWSEHQIVQKKIRQIAPAADVIQEAWGVGLGRPRNKPTIDDELSYQGAGDKHNAGDTIEAHLGAFLGGGYGTTGYKSANKLGQYFYGGFNAAEHTAADSLGWLRETIDTKITFWKMAPGAEIFQNLDAGARALGWPGREYVLGTNRARAGIVATLPEGQWTVTEFDLIARQSRKLSDAASGRFVFGAPASRAVLFHFKRQ